MGIYLKGITKEQFLKTLQNNTEFLLNDTDIVEVQESHGRLIDADEEFDRIRNFVETNKIVFNDDMRIYLTHILQGMKQSPTIIEAEGRE